MSNALIQLLVLAGIAIFLILRLKAVLGSREGFEKPPLPANPTEEAAARKGFEVIEGGPDNDIIDNVPEGSDAARALAAMKRAEPGFAVSPFLQGARGAYEMIQGAFNAGKLEQVRPFLSDEVHASFAEAIEARRAQGLTIEAQILGLHELRLVSASFDPASSEGEITVRFGAEMITVARDADGNIVEGDPKTSHRERDSWTFARVMGAADPNWRLVATDE